MKIKITPDVYFAIFILLSILFHLFFPIAKFIFYPYSLIGIIPLIMGIILVYRTNFILIKNSTSIKPFENPYVLITSGPFRFSRNPIYLGMTIILIGVVIILDSLFLFIFPIMFLFIINKSIIPIEESNLKKLFGNEFLEYKTKVRRWI